MNERDTERRGGWIRMFGRAEAEGRLREIYEAMSARAGSRPSVYDTPDGEVANIVRAHSLDPEGLALAFGLSTSVQWGSLSLPWMEREMLNTVTSAANNCLY